MSLTDTSEFAPQGPILMVEPAGSGGMAHYAYNLCDALGRMTSVHLLTSAPYELADRPRSFEVHVEHRSAWVHPRMRAQERGRAVATNLMNIGRLARLAREVDPALVHVQGHMSPRYQPLLVGLSRLCGGPPVVSTVHEVLPYERAESYRSSWSASYRSADGLIVHSRFVAGELRREYGWSKDVDVIAHGDYSFFRSPGALSREEACRARGLPTDRRLLLFIGYVRAYKGLDLLAGAWRSAVALGLPDDVDVVVAGSIADEARPHLAELERVAGARLHAFPGYQPEHALEQFLTAAHAVVAPYRACYTSGVIPLAFSFGLPVVATRVGSIPEHVRCGTNGVLAAPDDPADLARAMVRLFTQCDVPALGRGARRSADGLSWEKVARDTLSAYAATLARSRGGRAVVWGVR